VPSARDWEEQRVDSLGFKIDRRYGTEPTAELVCGTFNGYWDPKEFVAKAKELIDTD